MTEELTLLFTATIFGLTAGFSSGPLLTLVISETLRYGKNAGIKVALAPLMTDIPIVLVSLFILSQFSQVNLILGFISFFGALFIGHLAIDGIKTTSVKLKIKDPNPSSLKNGIITNALSPHPYIFYFSVGGPFMLKALGLGVHTLILFVFNFLLFLVGSKVLLAFIVAKSRNFLSSKTYVYIVRFLGVVLLFFALELFRDGLHFIGFI